MDVLNLDSFAQVSIDVIYHRINSKTIKELSEIILPCESYQVFSFEKILPELLLKMKRLKPGTRIIISFENNNYL